MCIRDRFINSRIANDKFEAMALMISTDVRLYDYQNKTMAQFLKDWSKNPDNSISIEDSGESSSCTYNTFVDRFILTDSEKKALVERFPEDFSAQINKLNLEREKIKQEVKDIDIYSYKAVSYTHLTLPTKRIV